MSVNKDAYAPISANSILYKKAPMRFNFIGAFLVMNYRVLFIRFRKIAFAVR